MSVRVQACSTYVRWTEVVEDEGVNYRISLVTPADPRLKHPFGYACECEASRTEPGECIHILIGKGFHCGWHEKFDPERARGTICPRCGEKLVSILFTA